jgi:hypothetical protein
MQVLPTTSSFALDLSKLDVTDYIPVGLQGPCWHWRGAHDPAGYSRIKVDGRCDYVRRVLIRQQRGHLTEQEQIVSLCRNAGCVNPAHLVVGTDTDARALGRHGRYDLGDLCFARQMVREKIVSVAEIAAAWGLSVPFVQEAIGKCDGAFTQRLARTHRERIELAALFLTPSPVLERFTAVKAECRILREEGRT